MGSYEQFAAGRRNSADVLQTVSDRAFSALNQNFHILQKVTDFRPENQDDGNFWHGICNTGNEAGAACPT